MSNEMTVGCIRTTVIPQQSGIYEALLEKAERERNEAREAFAVATSNCVDAQQRLREMEDQRDFAMGEMKRLDHDGGRARAELEMWRDGNIMHEIHRDELEKVERERNEAIQERERWKMRSMQKWGMRRELEELLGVKDTESDEQFAKGVAVLRDLIKERDEAREALHRITESDMRWSKKIARDALEAAK